MWKCQNNYGKRLTLDMAEVHKHFPTPTNWPTEWGFGSSADHTSTVKKKLLCVRVSDVIWILKCQHLNTNFMQFGNCRNVMCKCDDVYIYRRLKVKFSSAWITTQNTFLPGSNTLLRKLKRLSFPSAVWGRYIYSFESRKGVDTPSSLVCWKCAELQSITVTLSPFRSDCVELEPRF